VILLIMARCSDSRSINQSLPIGIKFCLSFLYCYYIIYASWYEIVAHNIDDFGIGLLYLRRRDGGEAYNFDP